MSISSSNPRGRASTHAAEGRVISDRKAKHLDICLDEEHYVVETSATRFDEVRLVHHALPEVDGGAIDASTEFLGHRVALPMFISCMTGGSEQGTRVNRLLAQAAQAARIPVGMGSIRVLFRDDRFFEQFHMKRYAPDVPVLANIGGVQVREISPERVVEVAKRLEVQGLVVHLNPGQELFQPDGDRDFRGLREAIARLCERSSLPIIVKETGFGIRPAEVDFLLEAGAAYVDIAGAGGTNWIRVESYRGGPEDAEVAREFDEWGLPTAQLLAALRGRPRRLLASGGIRTGLDVAKALALGARLAGLALPFIRAAMEGELDGVAALVRRLERSLRAAMTLCGAANVAQLRQAPLYLSSGLERDADSLAACDEGRT